MGTSSESSSLGPGPPAHRPGLRHRPGVERLLRASRSRVVIARGGPRRDHRHPFPAPIRRPFPARSTRTSPSRSATRPSRCWSSAGLFALTVVSIWAVDESDDDADLVVEVTAFQWQWRFDYPESGRRGRSAATKSCPSWCCPPTSSVRFELTSRDVIHSFWIPGFRFKRDVFPDQTTTFQVDVGERTGVFPNTGVCAEFCGLDHTTHALLGPHRHGRRVRPVGPGARGRLTDDRRRRRRTCG